MDATTVPTKNSLSTAALSTPLLARTGSELVFRILAVGATALALGTLAALLLTVGIDGWPRLSFTFISSYPSRFAAQAGILPALVGSIYLVGLVALFAFPLGVGAAVYLEEYGHKGKIARIVELNIANLAGVPSIIYGLLGLELFVRVADFGRSILSGALTLTLLVLPMIIIASREALRQVPNSIREGAYALGCTKWEAIRHQVLPVALPGIFTGCILAFSRAIGETAPLVMLGALTYVPFVPTGLFSAFTALPIQAFNWLSRPQSAFHQNAAAAIVVLLSVLLMLNAVAVWLRMKYQRRARF